MISTDSKMFSTQTATRKRITSYGEIFDELHVVVLSLRSNNFHQEKISSNVWIYSTNSFSKLACIYDAILLGFQVIKTTGMKQNQDVISCQDPFETAICGFCLKKLSKINLQIQIHTDFLTPNFYQESIKNKIRVLLAKFFLVRADCVRAVSDCLVDKLKSANYKFKTDPVVLPIFVDVQKIKTTPIKTDLRKKYSQFSKIILVASRLSKEKNISLALNAFNQILNQEKIKTDCLLLIVGSGPEAETLKSQVKKLNLGNNVIFEKWTDDLISYYKTADLFLLTSNYEGYGLTLVEAVASGLRVISSDVGIAKKLLPPENIFLPGDQQGLVDKIDMALKGKITPAKLPSMGSQREYLDLYRQVVSCCLQNIDHLIIE